MAYVIGDDCIACGTCIDECPAGAISEGDKYSRLSVRGYQPSLRNTLNFMWLKTTRTARKAVLICSFLIPHFSFLISHSSFKIYHQLAYEDGVLAVLVNRNRLAVHVLLVL